MDRRSFVVHRFETEGIYEIRGIFEIPYCLQKFVPEVLNSFPLLSGVGEQEDHGEFLNLW